jgi:hypothetical protein
LYANQIFHAHGADGVSAGLRHIGGFVYGKARSLYVPGRQMVSVSEHSCLSSEER